MRLLLHMCCGPCSVYPAKVLMSEGVSFEGIYYNPNIHPMEEFLKRKENVKKFADIRGIHVNYMDDFKQEEWETYDSKDSSRCNMCYSVRLEEAARYASENNFDAFTTTLLVSPYQNHDVIKQLGQEYAKKYGIEFYYKDFRSGFREGQQEAKEMDLYRQKYCGCIISYRTTVQKVKKTT